MKKYILVLDIGTTNVKAFIFDKQGKIITQAIEKTKYIIKTLGQVEQDPFEIWNLCKKVINRVIKKKRLKYNNFYSMGLTSQRGSFLLWNKVTGEKYTNIITW